MQQIVSITDARNNLSQLVAQVANNQQQVVIVRDSQPEAVLVPYSQVLTQQQTQDELWRYRWEQVLKAGKKAGKIWVKKNNIDLKKTSEEELYDLIDKI